MRTRNKVQVREIKEASVRAVVQRDLKHSLVFSKDNILLMTVGGKAVTSVLLSSLVSTCWGQEFEIM